MSAASSLDAPMSTVVSVNHDALFEIIDDERVELPPMSAYSTVIASELLGKLFVYDHPRKLGRPVLEALFQLEAVPGRHRRPDVAFVSFERWAKEKPVPSKGNAWPVTPDLAVEIISPTDYAEEVMTKTVEYFQAGVRQVWVIHPRSALIHLYRSLKDIRVFGREDTLTCEDLFPQFALPLAELFQPADDK